MCLDNIQAAFHLRAKCIESDQSLRMKCQSVADPCAMLSETSDISSFLDVKTECLNDTEVTDLGEKITLNLAVPECLKTFTNHEQYADASLKVENRRFKDVSDVDYAIELDNDFEEKKKDDKRKPGKNLEKTHMCSVCGKTFFTSGHLRSHELTHNNSKDFTCHSCGKKFLTKSYLNRHMKSHLNERNYKCKVCEKGFNTSTSLGYHFRLVHSGETNFHCTFCNKGFPLKIQLISHTR